MLDLNILLELHKRNALVGKLFEQSQDQLSLLALQLHFAHPELTYVALYFFSKLVRTKLGFESVNRALEYFQKANETAYATKLDFFVKVRECTCPTRISYRCSTSPRTSARCTTCSDSCGGTWRPPSAPSRPSPSVTRTRPYGKRSR